MSKSKRKSKNIKNFVHNEKMIAREFKRIDMPIDHVAETLKQFNENIEVAKDDDSSFADMAQQVFFAGAASAAAIRYLNKSGKAGNNEEMTKQLKKTRSYVKALEVVSKIGAPVPNIKKLHEFHIDVLSA